MSSLKRRASALLLAEGKEGEDRQTEREKPYTISNLEGGARPYSKEEKKRKRLPLS